MDNEDFVRAGVTLVENHCQVSANSSKKQKGDNDKDNEERFFHA